MNFAKADYTANDTKDLTSCCIGYYKFARMDQFKYLGSTLHASEEIDYKVKHVFQQLEPNDVR